MIKLQSHYAVLDVMRGRKKLSKLITADGGVDVIIYGRITDSEGPTDCVSREFTVEVKKAVIPIKSPTFLHFKKWILGH